jgi:hypothetical protein
MEASFQNFLKQFSKYETNSIKLTYNVYFDLFGTHELKIIENDKLSRYCLSGVKKKQKIQKLLYIVPMSSTEQISFKKLSEILEPFENKFITLGIVDSDMTIVYYDISNNISNE